MSTEVETNKETSKEIQGKEKKDRIWLKIILWILLIIFVLLIIKIARNYGIINMQIKVAEEYNKSNNMYRKISGYQGNTIVCTEYYRKGSKQLVKTNPSNRNKLTLYKDSQTNESLTLCETASGDKIANTNSPSEISVNVMSVGGISKAEMSNLYNGILLSAYTKWIWTEDCNGKECYVIDLWDGVRYWIDKETYLVVRVTNGTSTDTETGEKTNIVVDYVYEFNTVTDEQVQKPSMEGYIIKCF